MSDHVAALAALLPVLRQHDVKRFECDDFCIELAPQRPVVLPAIAQPAGETGQPKSSLYEDHKAALDDLFFHERVA
jgi:hypothetical protein